MRTRRLHARLAYVMRVDNCTPRPPVARGFVVKNADAAGYRIARLGFVMQFSLGTQAQMMRTRRLHARLCARLGKSTARVQNLRQLHTTRKRQC